MGRFNCICFFPSSFVCQKKLSNIMEDLKKNKRDCCLQGRNCRERGGHCELFKVYIYVKTVLLLLLNYS
jgi:hypothetical protein